MGLFSARVQFEFVPLFLCQFFTFPLFPLAVVCRYFPDLPGLVPFLSVVPQVVLGLLPVPLCVVPVCLRILRRHYLSRIVLVPLDRVDRYRYRFCRCPRVGLGYLPIPESLLGKVVQRWIGVVDSVRQW